MIALLLFIWQAGPPGTIAAFGDSGQSCTSALASPRIAKTESWVAGYFTGKNVAHQSQVGGQTDLPGIMAELRLVCLAEPSLNLALATEQVYDKLKVRKR